MIEFGIILSFIVRCYRKIDRERFRRNTINAILFFFVKVEWIDVTENCIGGTDAVFEQRS